MCEYEEALKTFEARGEAEFESKILKLQQIHKLAIQDIVSKHKWDLFSLFNFK